MTDAKKIRSGDEIVNEFFNQTLNQLNGLDGITKETLMNLFNSGELDADTIEQKLADIRKGKSNG